MLNLNKCQNQAGAPRALPGSEDLGTDGYLDDGSTLPHEHTVVKKPARTNVIPMNIPNALATLKQWVVWRYEYVKGRWTKVPHHAKYTAMKAKSNDSTTWSAYEAALEGYLNRYDLDGIGFVPSVNDLITGIDLDHCIDDSGNIAPWAQEIIDLLDSYTEISPSGHGVRIFIFGMLPGTGRKKGNIEIYGKSHYLTVTGHHIPSTPSDIQDRQQQLDAFMGRYFSEEKETKHTYEPGESILTDEELLEMASTAKNCDKFNSLWAGDASGYASASEADSALCFLLAFWTRNAPVQMDRLFRASGLYRDKWDEKHGKETYGQTTIRKAIANCTETYSPPEQKASRDDSEKSYGGADIEVMPWPTLDRAALHGLAGEAVELATRNSEADPAAVLATFLARFAAEVGAAPHMWVGDSKHYARLMAAIVGNSSKARKGTSAKPVERLFDSSVKGYTVARSSPGPLSSGEGLVYNVRDAVREWIVVDKKTQQYDWVVTDAGVTDKRLIIIDEEFGAALGCTKREGNTVSTIIRQSWDHGTIEPLTKTNRIKATGAHINIVTHITNAELQQKLHETEALNGFGNRFFWVCARRNGLVSRPMPMPEGEVEKLRHRIFEAAKTAQSDNSTMAFSEDAWELWDRVYPELSKDHPGLAGVIINRAEAQVVRLSMIYALLDQTFIIEPVHLEAALAFWKYCEDSALFIFGGREQDTVADRIIDILTEGPATATDIYNHFQRHVRSERIGEALTDLVTRGKITPTHEKTKGRTKTSFALNNSASAKSAKSALSNEPDELNTLNTLNALDEVEI